MKQGRVTRLTCGFALAVMAALSVAPVHAEDATQAVAPTTDSSTQTLAPAAPQGTVKYLGAVPSSAVETPAAATTAPGADIPEVAPSPPSTAPWTTILPPQQSGAIRYVTGGVGDDERAALGEAKKEFNLYIMSAEKDGSFVGDTQIVIRSTKGDELLKADAGPLLYVQLPAGSYTIEASHAEQVKKEKVAIGAKGTSNLYFNW